MKEKFLREMPDWYKSNEEHSLVLSDDIDSLVTTAILKKVKGWEVGYYYDFNRLYKRDEKLHTRVWCDIAIVVDNEKAFDNHVSRFDRTDKLNTKMINPNILNDVTAQNYTEKYCGSTALMVWSIYNLPLPKTEEGKMLLLCIDSMFKGYYKGFKRQNKFYLCDMFGFEELYAVQERHTADEFYKIIEKYNMTKKFKIDEDGYLHTDIDLKLISEMLGIDITIPGFSFCKKKTLQPVKQDLNHKVSLLDNVLTLAFVYRRRVSYTKLIKKVFKAR